MNRLIICALSLILGACHAPIQQHEIVQEAVIGQSADKYGCNQTAGLSYSKLHQQCVQPWDIADIKLNDPSYPQLTVYVIFAKDQSAAEIT